MTGLDRVDADSLFPMSDTTTRGHSRKIFVQYSRLELRKTFFSQRVVKDWNSLPQSVVEAESLDQFKVVWTGIGRGSGIPTPFKHCNDHKIDLGPRLRCLLYCIAPEDSVLQGITRYDHLK